MRIAIGRFTQESSTFSPVASDLETFERQGCAYGDDFNVRDQLIRSSAWAFSEVADARGDVELVPLVDGTGSAGGR